MANNRYTRIEEVEDSSENEESPVIGRTVQLTFEVPAEAAIRGGQNEFGGLAAGDILLFSPVVIINSDQHIPGIATTSAIAGAIAAAEPPQDEEAPIVVVDLNDEDAEKKESIFKRLKGIFAILFATSLIALNNQLMFYLYDVKKIRYSKSLFLAWSYALYCVLDYIPLQYMMCKDLQLIIKPLKDNRKLGGVLVIRGLLGSSIQFVTSHAIDRFKKPAPVSVITAMSPIFVYINAYLFLKEKMGLIPILNVFVAIGGVVVMNITELRHPSVSKSVEGTLLALTSMFLLSWVTVVIRFLKSLHPLLVNMAFGVGGVVVQGSIVLFENTDYWLDDYVVFGWCVFSATITVVGNFFYNLALQYESAGVVSLLRTSEVVMSFIFQFVLFGINPDLFTAIGGAMILFGVICVTLRKIVGESSENSRLRRYFWYLLY